MKKTTCHPERPFYCKGLCRNCYEKQLRINNPEYWERQKENVRKWGALNKEHRSNYDKDKRKNNPNIKLEDRKRHYKYNYNITLEELDKLIIEQDNKCRICNRSPNKDKRLHLDHNHETREIRGLLCAQCNWYVGFIEKDPQILSKIKEYLKYE